MRTLDQDGNEVTGWLDAITHSLVSGYTLIGTDGKRLPSDSAPVYLSFDVGGGKMVKVLNQSANPA